MKIVGWLWFVIIQILSLCLMVVGWIVLIPFVLLKSWHTGNSPVYSDRNITMWNLSILDKIYGNWEDGVVPPDWYMTGINTLWRTYMWTAWRNSTNNLRWIFLWKDGPWFQYRNKGYYFQAGWRPDTGWYVLSAGAGNGTVL